MLYLDGYKRQSRNVSNQQCSFTVSSPNKRSYLLSNAQIEYRFTFNRTDTAGGTFIPALATALNCVGCPYQTLLIEVTSIRKILF